ncbi:MAG: hypothetical protein JWM33_3622, partial [Caulobacteraceae bacterium]|nr:hypothetical protein [Caulobacteraceae bacterium]
ERCFSAYRRVLWDETGRMAAE